MYCGDCHLVVTAILAWVINLVGGMVIELTRYLEIEIAGLACWTIAAHLPCAVIVLYIDFVACFPIEVAAVVIHRCTGLRWIASYKGCHVLIVIIASCVRTILCNILIGAGNDCQSHTAKGCKGQ